MFRLTLISILVYVDISALILPSSEKYARLEYDIIDSNAGFATFVILCELPQACYISS